ncbi:hypothetical protein BDW66DRAFT_11169 [Aspergillus desertorum]
MPTAVLANLSISPFRWFPLISYMLAFIRCFRWFAAWPAGPPSRPGFGITNSALSDEPLGDLRPGVNGFSPFQVNGLGCNVPPKEAKFAARTEPKHVDSVAMRIQRTVMSAYEVCTTHPHLHASEKTRNVVAYPDHQSTTLLITRVTGCVSVSQKTASSSFGPTRP